MAEVTKYQLITNNNNNNNIISDLKTHFSFFKTRKSTSFVYAVVLIFVLFTVFLAFSPSPSSSSSSSPWFVNIFTVNSTSPTDLPDGSQINPSRSQNNATFQTPMSQNMNNSQLSPDKVANFEHNNNQSSSFTPEIPQMLENNTVIQPEKQMNDSITDVFPQISPLQTNQSSQLSGNQSVVQQIEKGNEVSPLKNNQTNGEVSPQSTSKSGNNGSEVLSPISPSPKNQSGSDIWPQITSKSVNNGSEVWPTTKNQSVSEVLPQIAPNAGNQGSESSTIKPEKSTNSTKKGSGSEVNSSDLAASLSKNEGTSNSKESVSVKKQGNEIEEMVGCDLYDGGWIRDESYPLYKPGSCKLVDEQFNCVLNGRPDNDYYKLKWKPKGCSIPRLNGGNMLKLLKGKRLVFVGDSLNRNMWESLVCILKNSVKNKKKVFEAFGRHHFRTEASYSFVFKDYNCTVEFFVAPFLVQQWEVKDKNGAVQETLRLDLMVSDADQYKNADYIVFNTGHWWTHDKTSKGEDYYQEGSHVYKQLAVTEAFRKAMTTWTRWVDANINPQRTHVLFRGYSASHFRGGQWNSGGQCDSETEPIKNETYLTKYPWKMKMFESVTKGMKTPVSFLNVTKLTDYRKDGHPSVYRKQHLSSVEKKSPLRYQDCSHWCLPGVPDSWNELLYAELLRKQYLDKKAKNKT